MADDDLALATMVLTWFLTSLAVITVGFRFYLCVRLSKPWASHDWIMLVALACQIAYQAGITLLCQAGSGRPTHTLSKDQLYNINKWSWIFAPLTHPTSILARVSIAIVLARLFGPIPWFRWYVIIFTGVLTSMGCVAFITNVAQSQPYAGLWDKSIPNVIRWNPQIYRWAAVVLQIFYVIWDLTFVLFPVMILWKLNMRLRQKVGLMLLMASLLIVMAAAASKMVISMLFTVGNTTSLDGYIFQHAIDFSTCVEQALVIIMGCVPKLHSIGKLSLPSVGSVSDSFATLVSKVRKMASSEKIRSSFREREHSSIEEIKLTPQFDISNNGRAPNATKVIASLSEAEGDGMPTDYHLRRTDSFTVTYHDRIRQKQDV